MTARLLPIVCKNWRMILRWFVFQISVKHIILILKVEFHLLMRILVDWGSIWIHMHYTTIKAEVFICVMSSHLSDVARCTRFFPIFLMIIQKSCRENRIFCLIQWFRQSLSLNLIIGRGSLKQLWIFWSSNKLWIVSIITYQLIYWRWWIMTKSFSCSYIAID